MPQFVHLHVHTQYSILDGASDIKKVVARAKELGMPALAITDHGNMYGVKEFHDVATKAGIKPILGCEVYVVKNRFEKDKDEKTGDHLVLLAKNKKGYQNLCKIVSYSYTEGFYYKPRVDKELLRLYGEGLICCSACLGGEIPQFIMRGDLAGAEAAVLEFREIFGDDYYLEMQLHPAGDERDENVYKNQVEVNRELRKLAAKHNIPLICSNDVHFVMRDDATAHDLLICLNTNRYVDEPNRMRYTFQEWLKSPDEMAELFPDDAEALENTVRIADKVEEYKITHAPLMPDFPPPPDFHIDLDEVRGSMLKKVDDETLRTKYLAAGSLTELEEAVKAEGEAQVELLDVAKQYCYLRALAYDGCRKRYCSDDKPELSKEEQERLEYELATIERMGFPGYFLIVWDFIRAGREMGVSVGPGRGSAAGSMVAYALKITNIDPLKYHLLFERFLNPDRISLPDVDVDFDEDGRADVLNYVTEKYGKKRVAQIVTYGTMATKLAIKDVARVMRVPVSESDRLTKMVPDRIDKEKGETPFHAVYRTVPEFKREAEEGEQAIRDTLKYAEQLEGQVRQTGVHACGVIIGKDDLELFAPISTVKDKDSKDEAYKNVVQYEGKQVESVGLIKMDFLGLRTLSIIKDALENVQRTKGYWYDIDSVPLDDVETYELFSRGDTTGLFQFESAGMKKYMRQLKPTRFEDLIAMNALYRPGPMDYIPDFIARKNGLQPVTYDLNGMEEYLGDTYGITVYQEQVMLLSQKLGGFTGGEADTLRKAMGKKMRDVLDKMKPKFIEGATERGHDPKVCEKVWGDWEAFASYAFNKSHATCYAYVAYQTGYLKAHYPSEFMAALLSRNFTDLKTVTLYMQECKRMGINVMGPDVNESYNVFTADKQGNVRFGMAAIKGVGDGAVREIVAERERGGRFTDIYDFVERVNLSAVNRKVIDCLAMGGAFDDIIDFPRDKFFVKRGDLSFSEELVRYGNRHREERENSQQSLFGMEDDSAGVQRPTVPEYGDPATEKWGPLQTLTHEKTAVGMYLSAHPLDDYAVIINNMCNTVPEQLNNLPDLNGRDVSFAGIITSVQILRNKSDKEYCRFKLEGYDGTACELMLFNKDFEKFRDKLYVNYFVFITGKVQAPKYSPDRVMLNIDRIQKLEDVERNSVKKLTVTLPVKMIDGEFSENLGRVVDASKGHIVLCFNLYAGTVSQRMVSRTKRVRLTRELINFLDENELKYTIS